MRWNRTQYMTKADQRVFHCGARKSLSNHSASSHEHCFALSSVHIFLALSLLQRELLTDAAATVRTQTVISFNSSAQIYYNRGCHCSANSLSLTLPWCTREPSEFRKGRCGVKRKSWRIMVPPVWGTRDILQMRLHSGASEST